MRLSDSSVQDLCMVNTKIPKRSRHIIQDKIDEYELDEIRDEEINNDFIKGFQCAINIIITELMREKHSKGRTTTMRPEDQ